MQCVGRNPSHLLAAEASILQCNIIWKGKDNYNDEIVKYLPEIVNFDRGSIWEALGESKGMAFACFHPESVLLVVNEEIIVIAREIVLNGKGCMPNKNVRGLETMHHSQSLLHFPRSQCGIRPADHQILALLCEVSKPEAQTYLVDAGERRGFKSFACHR